MYLRTKLKTMVSTISIRMYIVLILSPYANCRECFQFQNRKIEVFYNYIFMFIIRQ